MKNRVLLGILVASMFVLGILSVRAWDKYRVEERARSLSAEVQKASEREAYEQSVREQQERDRVEREQLLLECQAGVLAYESLSESQQLRTEKPDCTLADFES